MTLPDSRWGVPPLRNVWPRYCAQTFAWDDTRGFVVVYDTQRFWTLGAARKRAAELNSRGA